MIPEQLQQVLASDGAELAVGTCILLLLLLIGLAVRYAVVFAATLLIVGVGKAISFDRLMSLCPPDIFPKGSVLRDWVDAAHKLHSRYKNSAGGIDAKRPRFAIPSETYRLVKHIGSGDICDVYHALRESEDVVIKIPRQDGANKLLAKEREVLEHLIEQSRGDAYQEYFPHPIESIHEGGRRLNVFRWRDGFYTAEQIIRRYPRGLNGRHIAWMFNRTLEAIGYVHSQGWIHGAVLPPHLMFHAENHGLQLVGWSHAERLGRPLRVAPVRYLDWYPADCHRREPADQSIDVYLAAKSIVFLAGGDPWSNTIPNDIPKAIRQFLKGCLLESPNMRPGDAWQLHDEFNSLLKEVYGPPKYQTLNMS